MSKKLLSIVVPTFNSEGRISNLIEGIYQTLSIDFEIVIVDDCSTDGTKKVLSALSQKYENIRCIYQLENLGPGVARDVAFETIESEFVIFFDDDDILYGKNVEAVLQKMNIYDLDVAIMAYEYVEALKPDEKMEMLSGDEERFSGILQDSTESIIQPSVFPRILSIANFPWNKICRTNYLKKIQATFGSLRLHEDVPIHWNILCNVEYVFLTRESIGQHIIDQGMRNASRKIQKNRMQALDALRGAYYYVNKSTNRKNFIMEFYRFQVDLVRWASDYIPLSEKNTFAQRVSELFREIPVSDLSMAFDKRRDLYHAINHYVRNYH